jgi:hypothetical protein
MWKPNEPIMQVDDFVDQRSTGVGDRRHPCGITSDRFQIMQMLGGHLATFTGELQ